MIKQENLLSLKKNKIGNYEQLKFSKMYILLHTSWGKKVLLKLK